MNVLRRRAPAGLEQVAVAAAHAQRRAADRGDERMRGREVGLGVTEVVGLVAAVARREVHPDALQGGLAEGVVPRLAQAGLLAGLTEVAVGVRDDLGQAAVDDLVDRVDERLVEAVGAAHEQDVRAGRHRVHGLDVERLLAVPALGVALVGPADRVVGAVDRLDLAEIHRGWPWVVAYWLASCSIVGEAKASTIATVWPWPSRPPATAALVP